MWVKSQDEKNLANVNFFEVKKDHHGEGARIVTYLGEAEVCLGRYESEKEALEQLEQLNEILLAVEMR